MHCLVLILVACPSRGKSTVHSIIHHSEKLESKGYPSSHALHRSNSVGMSFARVINAPAPWSSRPWPPSSTLRRPLMPYIHRTMMVKGNQVWTRFHHFYCSKYHIIHKQKRIRRPLTKTINVSGPSTDPGGIPEDYLYDFNLPISLLCGKVSKAFWWSI